MDKRGALTLTVVLMLPMALLAGLFGFVMIAGASQTSAQQQNQCTTAAAPVDPDKIPAANVAGYGREQLVNAAYIMRAGQALKLSRRDQTIGVMTAMGESSLQVLDRGDAAGPDSRGLFQQRGNGAWGSYEDRMNPEVSATNFFKALLTITDRDSLEPTIVAHRVQANADPYHYEPHWGPAQQVVAALTSAGAGQASSGLANLGAGGAQRSYDLGPVKPHTQALADLLGNQFGIETIGGYRQDPVPDHPSGLAIDLMVTGERGRQIAAYAQQHAGQLGISYIIYEQRIWNIERATEGWRPMEDRGSPTQNHFDHVHITLKANSSVQAPGVSAPCAPAGSAPGQVSAEGWSSPGQGPITSVYGMRRHPVTGIYKLHSGIDLGGACESPIWAAQAGVVTFRGFDGVGNGVIKIDHGGGVETWYLHMYDNGMLVNVGDNVTAGQQIARVGSSGYSTGCHLHFEVHVNGRSTDPAPYMRRVGVVLGQ